MKQVPTANDPPNTFEVKLKQTQANLRRMYQLRQQQLTGGGYKPPEPLAPAPGATKDFGGPQEILPGITIKRVR